MRTTRQRLLTGALTLCVATGALIATENTAGAEPQRAGTVRTSGKPLIVRDAPTSSGDLVDSLDNESRVRVICQVRGERVTGTFGSSDIWNKISTTPDHFVSDAYVFTGSDRLKWPCEGEGEKSLPSSKSESAGNRGSEPQPALTCGKHRKRVWYAPNLPPLKDVRRFAYVDLQLHVCTRGGRIEQVTPTASADATGPGRLWGTVVSTGLPDEVQRTDQSVSVDFPVTLRTCLGNVGKLPLSVLCDSAEVAVRGTYRSPLHTGPEPLNQVTWRPTCSGRYACGTWAAHDDLEKGFFD